MESIDREVLKRAAAWLAQSRSVVLATVVSTWGSAPRQPGAMAAIRDDGVVSGSVSGGCVEDDLIARVKARKIVTDGPEVVRYGVTREEANRFGLPCGGTLEIVLERPRADWIGDVLTRTARGELAARTLDLRTGSVQINCATRDDTLRFDGAELVSVYGPRWRLLIIGAGQTSEYLARMAQFLDYEVMVCDPREEYFAQWNVPGAALHRGMPDDVVLELRLDARSAVVALTHDPKLDDMALLEALRSAAFYVGALGSHSNTAKRRERLAMFDLSADEIARLHGPVGLPIGSRTPPEIAVAVLAEMTAVRNRDKAPSTTAPAEAVCVA